MSGTLTIRFANDVPAMAVEVLSPDHRVVRRLMMEAGEAESVEVPSEASLLRLYLPSGNTVVLADPGALDRTVTKDLLEEARSSSYIHAGRSPRSSLESTKRRSARVAGSTPQLETLDEIRQHYLWRAETGNDAAEQDVELSLDGHAMVRLRTPEGDLVSGERSKSARDVEWQPPGAASQRPLEFEIVRPSAALISMRVPGSTSRIRARADKVSKERSLVFSVRLTSREPTADTILNYLARGDVAAAMAMERWARRSESLLESKMADPYSAAVGAYLLLRMRNFDLLHSWTRNLADWFDFLPDGCVLWAWQLIRTQPDRKKDITEYLLRAAERGLPIYTEGTRLLLDGLKLLGSKGEEALSRLREDWGSIVWSSPLTLRVKAEAGSLDAESEWPDELVTFDVSFDTSA